MSYVKNINAIVSLKLTTRFNTLLMKSVKNVREAEKRVVRLIKKGKSLDDILDFSSLPSERVQQLFDEHQN